MSTGPTHRCVICGAEWKLWAPGEATKGDGGSWMLVSPVKCGPCCENVSKGQQVKFIPLAGVVNVSHNGEGVMLTEEGARTVKLAMEYKDEERRCSNCMYFKGPDMGGENDSRPSRCLINVTVAVPVGAGGSCRHFNAKKR